MPWQQNKATPDLWQSGTPTLPSSPVSSHQLPGHSGVGSAVLHLPRCPASPLGEFPTEWGHGSGGAKSSFSSPSHMPWGPDSANHTPLPDWHMTLVGQSDAPTWAQLQRLLKGDCDPEFSCGRSGRAQVGTAAQAAGLSH